MLDQFIWGHVARISPEAPVPVVDFERESFMPGGAANVARNLSALGATTELFGIIGEDDAGRRLQELLTEQKVLCRELFCAKDRPTSMKTRIVAHQQQVVRVDRESRLEADGSSTRQLLKAIRSRLDSADAVIVGDYGKGVVTQGLLDEVKQLCRARGLWVSLDPKPVHHLQLSGVSLITPNRKEAFEMAHVLDGLRAANPLQDTTLLRVADKLLQELRSALLLITLGDQGMLLCQRGQRPFHIPTVAQEVFDVSGAGDTVIASFTLAIAAGASPVEAAILSNHAAGVVVGKVGTATVAPEELLASFQR
jgi:D-beta-D-heptose 7-phosphate kinase/D-beta-D-heptose 1-phosphate adenosyltransferase